MYTGNIADDYYNKTIGYNWAKNFEPKWKTKVLRDQTKQQIEIARGDKDWLGEEVKDLSTLPEAVRKYIKHVQDEE